MRSRYFWNEGRVWKRQPLAVTASSTPRSFHASRSSSSSLRRVSAPTSSSNIFFSSEIGTGCCAASSAASSTAFTSLGLSMGEFHVEGGVRLGLRDLEQAFPHQLQHREEIDDQHRHAARGLEQVAELGEAAAPQPAQDQTHVLAHRQLLARDAVVLAHLRPDEKRARSEEHTSELQSRGQLVCRLLLEKKNKTRRSNSRMTNAISSREYNGRVQVL